MITSKQIITPRTVSTRVASAIALGIGCLASASAFANDSTDNPYSPAYGHSYRHGAVPTREASPTLIEVSW